MFKLLVILLLITIFARKDIFHYKFSIKPRIVNISIDSSSLTNFLSSFLGLLQIIKRTNLFSKRYDIFGFSNFLHLPKITQYIFIHIFSY